MTRAELQMLDEYIKNKFTPPLSDLKLLRFKQKRCIHCGSDDMLFWCDEVPLCTRCDAIQVAWYEEQFEVPWQTYPSEE